MTVLSSAAELNDCNSQWAQGGIIYKGLQDTPEALSQDIHVAGAGRCSDNAVPPPIQVTSNFKCILPRRSLPLQEKFS